MALVAAFALLALSAEARLKIISPRSLASQFTSKLASYPIDYC